MNETIWAKLQISKLGQTTNVSAVDLSKIQQMQRMPAYRMSNPKIGKSNINQN
jgi:hypothetical protein